MTIVSRHRHNPVLSPRPENFWESKAVFNCGAILEDGKVHMLYRAIAEYEHYISRLGYAVSDDCKSFRRFDEPVFIPNTRYEIGGCEDPRLTKLNGTIYVTYVVLRFPQKEKGIARTALASTNGFDDFERHGVITPRDVDDKDVVLFPEKIGNKYVVMHRPNWVGEKYGVANPSMWLAYSNDLHEWSGDKLVMQPAEEWERRKVGAGPPPIKTKDGWLLLYHGVDSEHVYRMGAALLNLKDPSRVIARTPKPLLEPKESYERIGDVPNVIFPTGLVLSDDTLFIYYGGADKVVCLATVELNVLLDHLHKSSSRSK